jgi:hydrogenase maturation protease
MNPLNVLRMAGALNRNLGKILLVGCEPATLGGDEGLMGLSAPVNRAIDPAIEMIESLVRSSCTKGQ